MSSVESEFKKATEDVRTLDKLDDETLLTLYGLYKQSTVGDCNTDKPSFWDVKGVAKWNAWNDNKGMDKEKAMKSYTRKVHRLLKK